VNRRGWADTPAHDTYDVVIVGGAIYGASVSWFLKHSAFPGRILVIERDPTYEFASTSHTNSCIRQQFGAELNVRISQFGVAYLKRFQAEMGDDRVPGIALQDFGYLYLAGNAEAAENLRAAQRVQAGCGAGTRHLSVDEIAGQFPFLALDDIVAGNHNPVDEGYFDGATMFDWWRRMGRERGIEYLVGEVVGMDRSRDGARIEALRLADGTRIACGLVVNASGPRAALTAAMAGIDLPVEPRKRFTWIFEAETPPEGRMPLIIDPSGVHMRADGAYFMTGCPPDADGAVAPDDFTPDHALWEEKVWPALAARVPAFEAIRQVNSWVGHYAYNTLDQNAVVGPHPEVGNFIFANGFSGHGLQQSPAIGRGVAEWIGYGEYRSLDLTPLGYGRIAADRPFTETAII
jgi:glycine/D-amino acid oxidase-like deaminating enzyme